MRILLIGDQSIQNDAIISILNAEDNWEIVHITHDQFLEGISIDRQYQLSLVDLISSPYKPDEYIRGICEKKLSKYLVALCEDGLNERNDPLTEAGVNQCLPIDSDTKELLHIVSQFAEK